jgi:hypothetical protein
MKKKNTCFPNNRHHQQHTGAQKKEGEIEYWSNTHKSSSEKYEGFVDLYQTRALSLIHNACGMRFVVLAQILRVVHQFMFGILEDLSTIYHLACFSDSLSDPLGV